MTLNRQNVERRSMTELGSSERTGGKLSIVLKSSLNYRLSDRGGTLSIPADRTPISSDSSRNQWNKIIFL